MLKPDEPAYLEPVRLQLAKHVAGKRLKREPFNDGLLRSYAEICRKLGEVDAAAAAYERLANLDADDVEASYLAAGLARNEWSGVSSGVRAAPFFLVRHFLPQEFHDSLLAFVMSGQQAFVPALLAGNKGRRRYDPGYRDSLDFSGLFEGAEQFKRCLRTALPRVQQAFRMTHIEVESLEMNVRAYQDGHFFKVHIDVPAGKTAAGLDSNDQRFPRRVISFVYFFHRLPRRYAGGELVLFDSDFDTHQWHKGRFTQVAPEDNMLVLFPSNAYHCVVPVRCASKDFADSRFVVNGFIHQKASDPAGPPQSGAPQAD